MSGGGSDVALRFTWSTTHIEIYIFVRIEQNVCIKYFFFPFFSSLFFCSSSSFSLLFFLFFFLVCCCWLRGILTHNHNFNALLPFTRIYTLDFFYIVSFLKSYTTVYAYIFDIVWQARPTWERKKNMSTFLYGTTRSFNSNVIL